MANTDINNYMKKTNILNITHSSQKKKYQKQIKKMKKVSHEIKHTNIKSHGAFHYTVSQLQCVLSF